MLSKEMQDILKFKADHHLMAETMKSNETATTLQTNRLLVLRMDGL